MSFSIKNWDEQDRPREKLLNKGVNSLSDSELLAIIIGSGTYKESALDLSKKLLLQIGGLDELAKCSVSDLTKVSGIGPAKAVALMSVFEIGRRRKSANLMQQKINTSKIAFDLFKGQLCDLPHEEFWLLLLNRANVPVKKINISKGGVAGTVVDLKIIIKEVVNELASGVILFHNHPSGNTMASDADINITRKIKEALKYLDVNLLDHIIVANHEYTSFADDGIL